MNLEEVTRLIWEIIDSAIRSDDAYRNAMPDGATMIDNRTIAINDANGDTFFIVVEPA